MIANDIRKDLQEVCRQLKLVGEHDMADKVLCAYAAVTDVESPRVDLSYSYVMRELRKEFPDQVKPFQIAFKRAFDDALDQDLDEPANIALTSAIKETGVEVD